MTVSGKMRRRLSILYVVTLVFAGNAEETGLDLYRRCQLLMDQLSGKEITIEQSFEVILLTGYISGFIDFHSIQQRNCEGCQYDFCLPEVGISNEEAVKTVHAYIKKRPESVELSARMLIMAALLDRYPCRTEKPQDEK